jgi:putative methanogen marker protein 4
MKIVAGVGRNKNIVEASQKVDFPVELVDSEEAFADSIMEKKAQAHVRGSLNSSLVLKRMKTRYKELYRASCMEVNNKKFLLAPVGIDEGDHLLQKLQIIRLGAKFLEKLGIDPEIAIISGGRSEDMGRSRRIDESIAQGRLLTKIIRDKYSVEHYYILIEEAITDNANFILAPDGISGNLIFRSLVLSGCAKSHGAITLGIDGIYIDTSRSLDVSGYQRALEFARYLLEKQIQQP